jgi:anti-anti-sigma regulatory factor
MLKINTIESDSEMRVVLHGKLFEPWVSELRKVWLDKQRTLKERKFVVDLREITAMDQHGIELLSKMFHAGATFLTAGVLTKHLVASFRKARKRV